jgi:hypothetical protein
MLVMVDLFIIGIAFGNAGLDQRCFAQPSLRAGC